MKDNVLFYGDNLDVLHRYIEDESIDLIYLDPPFKSDQDYNILFTEKNGTLSKSQIQAFEDTWHWSQEAEEAYQDVVLNGGNVSKAMQSFRSFLGENDMMAYLSMMAPRLLELHRVLKPTGSIYLHCDPTASHYLKMLMDSIFYPINFRNEIIWKRTSSHSDAQRYGCIHDVILYYSKEGTPKWNKIYQPYDETYVNQYYRYKDSDGRRWMSDNLSAAGLSGGGYEYEWKGVKRLWRCPKKTMEKLDKKGRIYYTRNNIPRLKRYLDESKGLPAQDVWTDIEALRSWHAERLGYPTQKPEGILERIIESSCPKDGVILDPFCGCGTAVAVAHRLNRNWVGIDITHLAVSLIKYRLQDAYGIKVNKDYNVIGEPTSLPGAKELAKEDPYQFQWWALGLVGARPVEQKKGADKGIDGRIYFFDKMTRKGKPKQIIFSVKAGKVTVSQIRDLCGVVEREKASIGVFISLNPPTKQMVKEASSAGFYSFSGIKKERYPKIQLLTIKELLGGKGIQCPPFVAHGGNVTFEKAKKSKIKKRQIVKQAKL